MGRKSKYTEDVIAQIEKGVRMGLAYALAAAYGGIAESTFFEWMNTKPEFSERIKRADAQMAMGALTKIERAANGGDWHAAAWKIERRFPQHYGRRVEQIELSGKDGGPIEITDARAILAARLAAQTERAGTREDDREPTA